MAGINRWNEYLGTMPPVKWVMEKTKKSWERNVDGLRNTVKENWYLGFTSFGGPPVHFKIVSVSGLFLPIPPLLSGGIITCWLVMAGHG